MSDSAFKAFGVGDIGYGIGLADVNGDGNLDIVSSGIFLSDELEYGWQSGHLMSVLPGDGKGGFGPPTIYRGEPGMYSLAVADLKGDGFPDIITANQDTDSVSVYANDGQGGFGPPQGGYIGSYVNGVSTGVVNAPLTLPIAKDVNGDGNMDIAVFQSPSNIGANDEDNSYFQILAGNGDGTFTPTYTVFDITTPRSPQLAADVTGDGRADLIELDQATSSYHVSPAVPGPAMQIRMVSNPVIGSNGNVQINLAVLSSSSTTINLSTSDPAITIPTSITIPAGSVSQNVPFQLGPTFNPSHVFSIQAQLGMETETIYGTQATHVEGFTMYLAFTSYTVAGGQTTPDYLLNVGSVGGYSTTVQVQCMGLPAGASCLLGDPQLTLTGYGAITSLVVESTSSVPAGTYPFTVMATDGTISRTTMGMLVVVQGPALTITPTVLSFPMQTVGTTSSPQTVTITNSGSATMTLSVSLDGAITPDPNFAEINNCGGSLGAGQSCTASVTFTPTVTGSVSGAINVDANILGATRQYVNLSGTAEGKLIKLSTSSLNFNPELYVGQTSSEQSVMVWNTGTVPINFSGMTITGTNSTDFALAAGTDCAVGAQLGVGFGCAINVAFAPTAPGTGTATLAVGDDVSGSPQTVSLSGSASPPDFTMGPAPGVPSSVTITAGGLATFTIAVAPLGAFNQTVTLNCPGAPLEATCSVSPTSVTLSGSGSQNVTVTVTTKARSTATPLEPTPPTVPLRVWWITLMTIVALSLLAWWLERRAPLGRPWRHVSFGKLARGGPRRYFALGSILLVVSLLASCGGGGSAAAPSSPGTPAGGYAIIVNGTSSNLNRSTTLTLVVK